MLSVFAVVVKWEINIVLEEISKLILSKPKLDLKPTVDFVKIIAS
jgi:hypothetical protein